VVKDIQAIADLISQLHRFPRPTIAALDGDALAGGAGLALACDFVLATAGARVGYPEVRRGMVAAIVLHDLVRQVGDRRARELLLTGEPIGAEQAERWGLINRVVPASPACPRRWSWPARCWDRPPRRWPPPSN
jgi:methylglutaconyl-CoA hydratase